MDLFIACFASTMWFVSDFIIAESSMTAFLHALSSEVGVNATQVDAKVTSYNARARSQDQSNFHIDASKKDHF